MNITSRIWQYEVPMSNRLARIFALLASICLLTLGAYIRIPLPFTPVPVTLQTFFVIFISAALGQKYGLAAIAGYISLGAVGLPVFQGYGSGILHILGPTGGYLTGFAVCAFLTGYIFDKLGKSAGFGKILFTMFLGEITIYLSGVLWLCVILKANLYHALFLGVIPFLPGEAFKLTTASVLYFKTNAKIRSYIF
jgi:biotin transport system substrate-specific component